MNTYYIKKYGVHQLHRADCVWLPIRKGMVKLGNFKSSKEALQAAEASYNDVDPCPSCCKVGKKRRAAIKD